jgi:hypothetical protein
MDNIRKIQIIVDKIILTKDGVKGVNLSGKNALAILYGIAVMSNPKSFVYENNSFCKGVIAEKNNMTVIRVEQIIRNLIKYQVLVKLNNRGLYRVNQLFCEIVYTVIDKKDKREDYAV